MNLVYVLLSPTFGMHQYTADLANRMSDGLLAPTSSARVVTTATAPLDRYAPGAGLVTPLNTHGTGFSHEGANLRAYRMVESAIHNLHPALVHFTGVHLWNIALARRLQRRGVRVIQTLHDLAPHSGVKHRGLIRLWNQLIIASGATILVHGRCYQEQLVRQGLASDRVACTPLMHGFLGAAHSWPPIQKHAVGCEASVLFFGRVEAYKGADRLLEAWKRLGPSATLRFAKDANWKLIIAGPVAPGLMLPPLPPSVELRDRRIMDDEADALFRGADLLVLPYRDATQSALVAAAYAYGVPVVVTETGALPEYVVEGETGWVVPPGDAAALAEVLDQALGDRGRLSRMGTAGRAWFDAHRREEESSLVRLYRPGAVSESRHEEVAGSPGESSKDIQRDKT